MADLRSIQDRSNAAAERDATRWLQGIEEDIQAPNPLPLLMEAARHRLISTPVPQMPLVFADDGGMAKAEWWMRFELHLKARFDAIFDLVAVDGQSEGQLTNSLFRVAAIVPTMLRDCAVVAFETKLKRNAEYVQSGGTRPGRKLSPDKEAAALLVASFYCDGRSQYEAADCAEKSYRHYAAIVNGLRVLTGMDAPKLCYRDAEFFRRSLRSGLAVSKKANKSDSFDNPGADEPDHWLETCLISIEYRSRLRSSWKNSIAEWRSIALGSDREIIATTRLLDLLECLPGADKFAVRRPLRVSNARFRQTQLAIHMAHDDILRRELHEPPLGSLPNVDRRVAEALLGRGHAGLLAG